MLNFTKYYKKILNRLEYQKKVPNGITRKHFFDLYFSLKRPFVVQLGANDGRTHDSLYEYMSKYKLPGLLVEPQPDVSQRLKNNYKDNPNLKFANVAIGGEDGMVPFYRIKPSLVSAGKEYKASSGSSFFREQIVGNVINRLPPHRHDVLRYISDDPNEYIEEITVKMRTLGTLFREHHIGKIDLLLIDCQGFDYEILKQLDIERFSPDIINYEHALLSPHDVSASHTLLEKYGYRYFTHEEADTCAYKVP